MFNSKLKLFTDPAVLRHVNRNLLAEFFGRFTHLLPKYGLPNPISDFYPDILAEVLLQLDQFPAPLVQALIAVEDLAAPEKHPPLDPDTNNPDAVHLAQAIRLWLHPPASQTPLTESPSTETLPTETLQSTLSTHSDPALPTETLHSALCSPKSDPAPFPTPCAASTPLSDQ